MSFKVFCEQFKEIPHISSADPYSSGKHFSGDTLSVRRFINPFNQSSPSVASATVN
jgi:hypothetical protein